LTDVEQDCTAHSFEAWIYFNFSATNFPFGSVVFCQGGTVLCLLLNVSLVMTPVFYYKPFPWWGNVSLSLFCWLFLIYLYKGSLQPLFAVPGGGGTAKIFW
jgi:hypothetical protein